MTRVRPSISVIVPTYRRPDDLRRCLTALAIQSQAADEVVVVYRPDDTATRKILDEVLPGTLTLKTAHPEEKGVVSAYNCGIDASAGDVIAFTDDDAAPAPDWIERIVTHFAVDPAVAGIGGRDRLHIDGTLVGGESPIVGKLQWIGRTIGRHHLGIGPPRDVDILKGVNMSFRRSALGPLRFDRRLLGPGAQVDCELALCLSIRRRGGRLIYDPAVVVEHFTAPRHDIDQRRGFNADAQFNQAHNETVAVFEHLPALRRAAFAMWAILLGTRAVPGLVQGLRLRQLGLEHPLDRVIASLRGRRAGLRTVRSSTTHAGRFSGRRATVR